MKMRARALELFAGAGGMMLGFKLAGIETVAAVENDQHCANTLRTNFPDVDVIEHDIRMVSFEEFRGRVTIVSGGVPCQPFSYAGDERGFDDIRGTLFFEFVRCLREVNPPIFVMENVRGMKTHDGGRTFRKVLGTLLNTGYIINHMVLNSVHFGVPQRRERLVIIGVKPPAERHIFIPEPIEVTRTLRDALKDVPKSAGYEYSEAKRKVMELVPPGGYWRDLPEDIMKEYMGKAYYAEGGKTSMARRLDWDSPCLTLTTSPSQKKTERCHPDETRPLTIREYARVQTFPDWYKFTGSIGSQYKQIGNAVPVGLAYHIGKALVRTLEQC